MRKFTRLIPILSLYLCASMGMIETAGAQTPNQE